MNRTTKLEDRPRRIREKAIARHHAMAGYFEDQYRRMEQDYYGSSFTYGRHKLQTLLDEILVSLPPGSAVLDVGCGTGPQIRRCTELGLHAVGIEPAANMREVACRLNPNVPIIDGVITNLPFPDRRFDFVLAIEVLRYLDRADIARGYAEMWRVLKPGGRMLFTLVSPYALNGFYVYHVLRRAFRSLLGRNEPVHCTFITPAQVRHDMTKLKGAQATLHGRVCIPIRPVFKVNAGLGSRIVRSLERTDDFLARKSWMVPFADQLIVVVKHKDLTDL